MKFFIGHYYLEVWPVYNISTRMVMPLICKKEKNMHSKYTIIHCCHLLIILFIVLSIPCCFSHVYVTWEIMDYDGNSMLSLLCVEILYF